jgi:hypothetical protein
MRASKTTFVMLVLGLLATMAFGQQQQQPSPMPPDNVNAAYRLDYVIAEVENGKKVNTRTYTLLTDEGGEGNMHLGMKIAVQAEKGPIYLDVGIRIDCRLRSREGNNVWLSTRFELSTVSDQPQSTSAGAPPLRTVEWSQRTVIPVGKSVDIASGDDLSSQRRFELSVTVTKLR